MNDRLRVGTRFGMVLVMLYYLGMSIEFLFFHPAIEATFGMKIPDPEMLRFFWHHAFDDSSVVIACFKEWFIPCGQAYTRGIGYR